ncbi:MAG TPA: peptide chain release factor N(5)-glutamine methyltransferase [Candidatus Competibacteraceae bacterium]|nr:peptide chain release factor N(5)-glutamine methyltransferase [Candidatus Competibacteraceae bacterium]
MLTQAIAELAGHSNSPRADAELLLAHALSKPRSFLRAWPEHTSAPAELATFRELLARRRAGEPVAYLLGEREFWSLPLAVTPATLIPRPETELLVELALARLPPERPLRVADLGTGSGAIALAIARERPYAQVVATDVAADTLAVAQHNAHRLRLTNVVWRQGSWCAPLAGERFDLIVSNPPYLAADDPHLTLGDLPFEPRRALVAGHDGLDAIRAIVAQAPSHLLPGGWLLLEHGYDQGERVLALLTAAGFVEVQGACDLAGIHRVSLGRWPQRPASGADSD